MKYHEAYNNSMGNRRLKAYVFTASELLKNSHYHGIVETDAATIMLSTDVSIDPFIFSQAAECFREKLNKLLEEQDGVK